ncbi:DUF4169 family protein [Pseudooceanicola sp. C21-150M6]|uniref:DUF4169 family protein n=1 Tax=Pseudooceanicola sp. C21-150M6 TaxID=3434355 RepID=UPI003D7F4758
MADIVNLNRFRKHKAREDKRATADQNALKHGRSKSDKARDQLEKNQQERHLDNHRIDED